LPAQEGDGRHNKMESYYVNVIKSTFKNWHYVGFRVDINKRFNQHNHGQVKSTKFYKPFMLLFVQVLDSRSKARDLEKFLKIRFIKEALLKIIS
jgi:putative endonuclease